MDKNLDLIIKGNVITVVNQMPRAEAIGLKDGKIIAVGSVSEVEKSSVKAAQVLDLRGKTVLPGFIDSHCHPMGTGRNSLGVDLEGVKNVGESLTRIKERALITPPGQWIRCSQYNRLSVPEKRFPTKEEMDNISMVHPIWVQHYDGHFSMLNTAALKILEFSANLEGVATDSNGELTGLIQDPATGRVMAVAGELANHTERMAAMMSFTQEAARVGLTTIFAKESLESVKFIRKYSERFPVRIHTIVMTKNESTIDEILQLDDMGEHVCVANVGDGSIEGRTAALYEPYTDDTATLGMLYHSDEQLYHFVEKAHKAGLQISIHAESDRSIDQALWVYEKVLEKYPCPDHRHRIEHFELPTMRLIRWAAKLKVALGMQPKFISDCEGPNLDYYRSLLGDQRVKRSHPFRSILDEGVLVSGGSDSPVTKVNPLEGIQNCVTHPTKEQRIQVYEAIEIFTINGAKIGFEEKIKGSIEPGKAADFVVLAEDPYRVPLETIGNISVEMTIVGGKIVYEKTASGAGSR